MSKKTNYRIHQTEAVELLREFNKNPDMKLYFVQTKGSRKFSDDNSDYVWEYEPTKENITNITPFISTRCSTYAKVRSIWSDYEHQTVAFSSTSGYISEYYIGGRVMTKEGIEEEYGIDMSSGSYGVGPACGDLLAAATLHSVDYVFPPDDINGLLNACEPRLGNTGLKAFLLNFAFQVSTCSDEGYVTYYRNYKDYKRDRRTKQKAGRAFRYMFPDLSTAEIENLVRTYNKLYSKISYRVVESTEAHDFNFAYSGDTTPDRNPNMSYCWKPLSASCMHYDAYEFGSKGHPAESYASGDFSIVYAVTDDNKVGARCVVYLKDKYHGPIYTMDTQAGELLGTYLKDKGYRYCPNWDGAKIQPQRDFEVGGILRVPYLDGGGNYVCGSDGNVYIGCVPSGVSILETYAGQETAGYIYPAELCDSCGDVIYDGDGWHIEDHPDDGRTCGCCGSHVWTQDTENVIPMNDATYFNGEYYEEAIIETCTYSGREFIQDHEDYIVLLDGEVLLKRYLFAYINECGYDEVPEDERPAGWDDNEDDTEERVA